MVNNRFVAVREMKLQGLRVLLDGMLAKDLVLDLVKNFISFDQSRPGGAEKIVAHSHQVLGVNNPAASVIRQEELKQTYPLAEMLTYRPAPVLGDELQAEATDTHGGGDLPNRVVLPALRTYGAGSPAPAGFGSAS